MSKVILYSYFRSSCSWRVRIALTLKNIEYEYRHVDILKPVADRGNISLINPLGTVPVIEIDGIVIPNSTAILDYLEETYEANPLLPKNAADRMKARAIADAIVAGIQPIQNITVLQHINNIKGNTTGKEWGAHYVRKGFQAIETLLSSYSGKYCVGDELSLADICLVPQVFNAAKFDVDMDHFPIIKSINEKLLQLDAFKLTHPFRQPDCPPELKIN